MGTSFLAGFIVGMIWAGFLQFAHEVLVARRKRATPATAPATLVPAQQHELEASARKLEAALQRLSLVRTAPQPGCTCPNCTAARKRELLS